MPENRLFPTTTWTLVLRAAASQPSALEQFCVIYWPPVYAYFRAHTKDSEYSKDLTQSFFAVLLENGHLQFADQNRGRFRSFLCASLHNFLCNEWNASRAAKRGYGKVLSGIDLENLAQYSLVEPAESLTPEKIFEKQWALLLLDLALRTLRQEYESAGRGPLFDALKPVLTGLEPDCSYQEIGQALSMTESAVKMAAHRIRRRFGQALREEVGRTVADPADVQDEIRHLAEIMST